ncbi:MAG TPA: FAD-dependent oxidoreductase [Caulobacteraceae bacterium]|jgi:predicted NAD/FAD-binding protein
MDVHDLPGSRSERAQRIAVCGAGISGLSAAWLLSKRHKVTLYETGPRLGGHTCTVRAPAPGGDVPVDMGFIVYNEAAYPNLVALFRHLGVPTRETCMSLGISLDDGDLEYGSRGLGGLLAQPSNLIRPRFLSMISELIRFYRDSPRDMANRTLAGLTLGDYLNARGYSEPFQTDHLLPQAAAIWSSPVARTRDYPVEAFVRFFDNHGLLKLIDRPLWRTVVGGSSAYVDKLMADFRGSVRLGHGVGAIRRLPDGVQVRDRSGSVEAYDQVVIASHADQALAMLDDASTGERALLGDMRYGANKVVLHTDDSLMPRRRRAWSSWNYVGHRGERDEAAPPTVSYWMNRLQGLPGPPLFVTLNPARPPRPDSVIEERTFDHPLFDSPAIAAQVRLWSLQGCRRTWFCGAYFGSGFHEDGLQSGLAVAEAIGGVRRPWTVPNESGRLPGFGLPLERAA